MDSPYLEAIQGIPGSTPGEKYKSLNEAATSVKNLKLKNPNIDAIAAIKSLGIPDPLIPLVHVEVSKNLGDPVGIIEALKSEDEIVFERALKAKWFFDGSKPEITNGKYFDEHLFPHVSLNHRGKIVKKLSVHLAFQSDDKSEIAEGFYDGLNEKYGRKLVEPLLIACSEKFIRKLIIEERKFGLSMRLMKIIYGKYPNVIIDFLKLSQCKKLLKRTAFVVNLLDYRDFLPILLKRNFNTFIDIIEKHEFSLGISLSRKRVELLMKQGLDEIIRSPRNFLPMMPLRVMEKLTKAQFTLMFRNIFHEDRWHFNFEYIFGLLEYYQEDKMELLLSTFEEVYGVKLLDCEEQLIVEVLRALPPEERARQARKKLEKDEDWHLNWDSEKSWRCYLPVEESIPMIKAQISKSSDIDDRKNFLKLMIFTCAINKDEGALLEMLKYMYARHKNEQGWMLLEVLGRLMENFQIQNLSDEHWRVLDDFIRLLHVKDELNSRVTVPLAVITAGIHFKLIHELPIDDKIDFLIQLYPKHWSPTWNILTDYPDYERKCLETFLNIIETKYPESRIDIWKEDGWRGMVVSLVQAIYNFNERNSKNRKSKLENFSLKSYPWLLEAVKKLLNDINQEKWVISRLLDTLEKGERDVWESLVPNRLKGPVINFRSAEVLRVLRRNPKEILENWEKYLKGLQENIFTKLSQRFFKACRWHQELPIKFSNKSVINIKTNNDSSNFIVLALLYDGSTFERVITPFIPKSSKLNPEDANARDDFILTYGIPRSLNLVIPPVSPDVVLKLCVGDYIHTAVNCLTNIGRRVSADKVIPFAMKLMERGVSIKKHGIRLFVRVGTIDEIRILLTNLLRNEKHRSIRAIVLDKIMQMFRDDPCQENWGLLREAIEDLRADDDAITPMTNISNVPDEFVTDYTRLMLAVIRKLEGAEGGLTRKQVVIRCTEIIHSAVNVDYAVPEELHEFILKNYYADLSQLGFDSSIGLTDYIVQRFLGTAEDKLESRVQYLTGLLKEIIEKYWDVRDEERRVLLGNRMINQVTREFMCLQFSPMTEVIEQSLFKTFFSILKPSQEPTSYLFLTYASVFEVTLTPSDFAEKIIELLPIIIAVLSRESLALIADVLLLFVNERFGGRDWRHHALSFVESLIKFENEDAKILASMMVGHMSAMMDEPRFWRIVTKLQKYPHPGVIANVYMSVNRWIDV
ncbi:uncharacterized protein LOC135169094 [Diachasmimorpha longicaudata]|uniref:uncharacterized protein LOC135169094 n=1 Tax=Diachasmimorpha longicaudata TaxID=58733 RepID=UPI0030B8A566